MMNLPVGVYISRTPHLQRPQRNPCRAAQKWHASTAHRAKRSQTQCEQTLCHIKATRVLGGNSLRLWSFSTPSNFLGCQSTEINAHFADFAEVLLAETV